MEIPATLDGVGPEWFGAVLDAQVAAVEVIDAHSGTTGRARIRVDSGGALPDTLFVQPRPPR